MKNNTLIQLSSGRTYLGAHAMGMLGDEAAKLGKRALVLADQIVWGKIKDEVNAALEQAGVDWKILFHTGHCSRDAWERISKYAVETGSRVLIGIGGGRLLDTAKIASEQAGIRSITVPASAATCAASAWLSVEYTRKGAFVGNYWTEYPPFCTIIDTDLIVRKCPPRLNMAGMVDAMAKYPEIEYNLTFTNRFDKNAYSEAAVGAAGQLYDFFMEHYKELQKKYGEGVVDVQVEDAVAKAVSVTGLISSLACGGKQAAISHLLYSYICCRHPQVAEQYLHGEIVGASLCYQLAVNGRRHCEVEALRDCLHGSGMPTCLRELGLDIGAEEKNQIFDYLKPRLDVSDMEIARMKHMWPCRTQNT